MFYNKIKVIQGSEVRKKQLKRMGICMKNIITKHIGLYSILVVMTMTIFLSGSYCMAAEDDPMSEENYKRVLFLSAYSYAWDAVQIQIDGIREGIAENVIMDYEFMDTKRFDDEEWEALFLEGFRYRMANVEPYDAVILGDDAALLFALKYRSELFDGIPLVFEGVNDENLAVEAAKDPLVTGVLEKLSFEKNIDFALSIYPNAKRVVGIFDETVTGKAEQRQFYMHKDEYPELEFAEINSSKLTTKELIDAISSVDTDSILIYVVMNEDADGVHYTNSQSIDLLVKYANVPAFRMVSGGIGEGLLGGNIVSMEKSGKLAAQIASEIANGCDSSQYNIILDSPNEYYVDEDVMRKFNISLSHIPKDAVVVNHRETYGERYGIVLVPACLIILFLIVTMFFVLIDNNKKKELAKKLEIETHSLENDTMHDYLTGLGNRKKLNDDVNILTQKAVPYTLVMIDIDDFKKINDTYGHGAGDEALISAARRFESCCDELFEAYRLAGDEFTFVIKSTSIKKVNSYIKKVHDNFTKPVEYKDARIDVTLSMGAARFPIDADNVLDIVACADKAMYSVKKSCKNAFEFYNS